MSRPNALFLTLSGLVVLGLTLSLTTYADDKKDAGKADDCYKFVVPLESVMRVVESVYKGMPEKAKSGKWKDLKHEANFLAEMANLATHDKDHHGKKEFIAFAAAMQKDSQDLSKSAEKKDEEGFKKLHAAIEKTCDACHEKFRDN